MNIFKSLFGPQDDNDSVRLVGTPDKPLVLPADVRILTGRRAQQSVRSLIAGADKREKDGSDDDTQYPLARRRNERFRDRRRAAAQRKLNRRYRREQADGERDNAQIEVLLQVASGEPMTEIGTGRTITPTPSAQRNARRALEARYQARTGRAYSEAEL